MYFKIKSLAAAGKKIKLHYFDYSKKRNASGLECYCQEIIAYRRKSFLHSLSPTLPYIVASRLNRNLINKLNEDNNPVLLEGLHCAGIIPYLNNNRRIVIRMHNEEENYYRSLFKTERNLVKKIYFKSESLLIKKFTSTLDKNISLACLSKKDLMQFSQMGFKNLHFIPCFIPWQSIEIMPGKGNYALYHGNMAVSENEEAALWLAEKVFNHLPVELVIAGNKISTKIKSKIKNLDNVKLVNNPSIEALEELIMGAHINVLPSMNNTGVKLKLLHALAKGRFCVSNTAGVEGSGISSGFHLAEDASSFRELILSLFEKEFTQQYKSERQQIFELYNNQKNAEALNALW